MIAAKPPEPHLVRGTASLNTQAVKLVAPLIVMKPAALVERIPAQMAAVDTANAANLALLQVAHHQVPQAPAEIGLQNIGLILQVNVLVKIMNLKNVSAKRVLVKEPI